MKICENQKPLCRIHIPQEAYPVEGYSAKQLKMYLKKITGANFNIVRGIPWQGPAIIIAEKNHTNLSETQDMAPELVMRLFDKNRLFLIGGDKRGTLLGIYDFLHKEIGCIFAQPDIEYIPRKETIDVSESFYYHKPFMKIRYMLGRGDMQLGEWCAKARMTYSVPPESDKTPEFQGERELLSEQTGRTWSKQAIEIRGEPGLSIGDHVCEAIMPPSKYFNQHPEYFAYDPSQKPDAIHMVKDGRTP